LPEARHSATRPHKPLTVIGLGNEYLSDDGAGIGVLREVRRRLGEGAAVFEELSIGGLPLLDYIVGFDRCVIIDAVVSGEHPPGTLYRFVRTPESAPVRLSSSHQVDLSQLLQLAQMMGASLPQTLMVYGVEAEDVTMFRERCTRSVAAALPILADLICEDLRSGGLAGVAPGSWQVIQSMQESSTVEHS